MAEKPKATSTPKILNISSRRPIGHSGKEFMQSPISYPMIPENAGVRQRYHSQSHDEKSDSCNSNDESEEIDGKDEGPSINTTFCNCLSNFSVTVVFVTLLFVFILYCYGDKNIIQEPQTNLDKIKQKFPLQVEDFWLSIQIGIEEILRFHQPKTFLFLYDDEGQRTADKIIYEISKFAVCTLTNCAAIPVQLEGSDLNTTDVLEDYGKIIIGNQKKIEKSGVMIIKNLEKIPGSSAQAFHSFCDEYNPLVEKALFMFTMKVERLHETHNIKFVENYLRNLWSDIEDDKFYPLFTRISSNIFPIMVKR